MLEASESATQFARASEGDFEAFKKTLLPNVTTGGNNLTQTEVGQIINNAMSSGSKITGTPSSHYENSSSTTINGGGSVK